MAREPTPVAGGPGKPMDWSDMEVAPDRRLTVTDHHSLDEPAMKPPKPTMESVSQGCTCEAGVLCTKRARRLRPAGSRAGGRGCNDLIGLGNTSRQRLSERTAYACREPIRSERRCCGPVRVGDGAPMRIRHRKATAFSLRCKRNRTECQRRTRSINSGNNL